MSHFAEIDGTGIVLRVIVAEQDFIDMQPGRWVQCSYNNRTRKQYPGAGYTYDPVADVFVAPQPFPSWTLDAAHDWQPPVPRPAGDAYWSEDDGQWLSR
jgi:hypothetical protein